VKEKILFLTGSITGDLLSVKGKATTGGGGSDGQWKEWKNLNGEAKRGGAPPIFAFHVIFVNYAATSLRAKSTA